MEQTIPKPNTENSTNTNTPTFDIEEIWKISKEHLRLYISEKIYRSWFTNVYLEKIENGIAEISCDKAFNREWIESNHRALLKKILKEVTGQNLDIVITVRSAIQKEDVNKEPQYEYYNPNASTDLFTSNQLSPEEEKKKRVEEAQLNPKYIFPNFIVGAHNRLAHAVGEGVVEELGTAYNPVFIYGPTGVGKTHLMQAIGNEIIDRYPDKQVLYIPIEQFLNEMIDAIRTQKNDAFRKKYREIDLLMIDDIQFIESRKSTQEEIFHTFNALYQANKQIILASDRPPREIKDLADRLRSRFEGGMVADIQLPDYETRMAILRQLVEESRVGVDQPVLELIAKNIESNVRELEGAVTKIISITRLGQVPDEQAVAQMLQFDLESKRKRIRPERIISAVSEVFDVTPKEIKGNRRTAYIAESRQVVMYLLRDMLKLPLEKVAREVNRKDHTTVLHACEKITGKMENNIRFKEKIEQCQSILNS